MMAFAIARQPIYISAWGSTGRISATPRAGLVIIIKISPGVRECRQRRT